MNTSKIILFLRFNTISYQRFIMRIQYSIAISILFIFGTCSDKKASKDEFASIATIDTTGQMNEATSELATEVIKSIPPPVEMSSIIKNSGADYANEILNPSSRYENYNTNFLKSINLGVYGADLGYINIYNHKEDALTYLNTVVKLAEDLKVGQFFDFETIKRVADNNKNLDSLLNITTSNFEKMNNYLQEQQRSNISMYMLTGGWIEALYIASKVSLDKKNKDLYEKIGEQKIALDQILLLLSFYKHDPNAVAISKDLTKLKDIYSNIKIETVYAEPTMVEENGMLVVKDNSKTIIKIEEAQVVEIFNLITTIRNKIVS
ncbi:MAG: hypothetical protein NW207_06600 [Cytophagales bacterium]|nr:hypothetical protein [Cytophagales bacterium]